MSIYRHFKAEVYIARVLLIIKGAIDLGGGATLTDPKGPRYCYGVYFPKS